VLRGKFISAYITKTETSQINNLMMHLKFLEKQEQTKPKTNRQREIIKIRPRLMRLKLNKLHKESMKQKVGSLYQKDYSPRPSRLHPRNAGVVQHMKSNKRNKPH
jgi:hypothetical protein